MALTATIKIVLRRGTLNQWQTANPVLLSGEVGFVTDAGYFVIGDGVNNFNALAPVQQNQTSSNRYRSEQYIVQNLINPLATSLTNAINAESLARTNADAQINQTLSSEITLRASGDANLQSQITAEAATREAGDTALAQQIYQLATDISNWYGTAQNIGDLLVYDGFSFQVLPVGVNGQTLKVSTASPIGLAWQNDLAGVGDMTKAVYDVDDDGIVDAAEREQIDVINKTGATLTKGTIVYIKSSSSSAQYPEVLKADATNEAASSKTIGAVFEDIPNDSVGHIITSGQVHNLNTSAYPIGTKLWLSTSPGQVTNTPPVQPYHTVFIGHVTRSQTQNGRILYAIQNGYEIGELHDVSISGTPSDGDVLSFSNGLWRKDTITGILGYTPASQAALSNYEPVIQAGQQSDYYRGDKTWQTLSKSSVGLGNVDNTSDLNKPISSATQTALNAKENTITAGTTSQYWRGDKSWQTLNKAAVGLSNVDNTSDANKPISSATQTVLNQQASTISGIQTDVTSLQSSVGNLEADVPNRVPYTGAISNVELGNVAINATDAQTIAQLQADRVSVTDLFSQSVSELTYDKLRLTDLSDPINPKVAEYKSSGITFPDGSVQTTKAQEIITLTTNGNSGAATFNNNTLNIPQYSGGGGGITAGESIAYAIALG